uniref:C2H2-type domain-containing protein n=1 Tax=Acanthochromis polyacanthus TaxID=80966 RepID=A0A3Q1GB69_9TELE
MKDEEEELCISLDSDNSEPLQVEEEQRELCSSQQGGQLGTFMRIFTHEENNHSDPKPINGQLLFCNSHLAESPDQEGSKHPTSGSTHNLVLKTHDRNSSHSNNVDNSFISQIHCDADTSKKTERCDVCGKAFIVKYLLKAHYRSHTGEKPFSCETCGESFTCRDHMTDHMRTHTGEKLYLCKICGKRFYDLVRSCNVCNTWKHRCEVIFLKKHFRIHTDERLYS